VFQLRDEGRSNERGAAAAEPSRSRPTAAEFEASGLNRSEFCRSRELNVSTLDAYRKRLRQRQPEGSGVQRWVEVAGGKPKAGAPMSGLAVALGQGRRIEVSRGFDSGTLDRLLSVLERA